MKKMKDKKKYRVAKRQCSATNWCKSGGLQKQKFNAGHTEQGPPMELEWQSPP